MAKLIILVLFQLASTVVGEIEPIPMPDLMQDCFTRYSRKTNIAETVGESIASFCVDQYIWRAAKQHAWRGFNVTREAYEWAHSLLHRNDLRRFKRQTMRNNLRVRREYRRLSDQERANFHRAIQLLKADTSILPNRYDALSAIHQGIVTTSAHGGPNFLAFHRVYILMFENALREKVPSVTLPYWDSTLDEPMRDPRQSILFTETFLGNGHGLVNTGPFAGWTTMSGPLTRNIGQSGQLFKSQDINRIISSLRLAAITEPLAPVNTSLEFLHNQVHIWIDGQMGTLNTASHDPVFWLHHSYVDYVWEIFRRNQRTFRIDPTRDYPMPVNDSMHMPGVPMGISNFRNIDGFSDVFTSRMYTYEPSPTCSQLFPDCGSPYLRCVFRGFRTMCMSHDWSAAPRTASVFPMFTGRPVNFFPSFSFVRSPVTRQMAPALTMNPQQTMQQQVFNRMRQQEAFQKEMENGGEDLSESQPLRRKRRSRETNVEVVYTHTNDHSRTTAPQQAGIHNVQIVQGQFRKRQAGNQSMFTPANRLSRQDVGQTIPTCPTVPPADGYQNTFNINGRSDIHQWVYIPVKIIYQRPPSYGVYTSYPVVNGEAEEETDIYSPARYQSVNKVLQMGKPASWSHCSTTSGAGKVYVTSRGINYIGTYKEYAIVDQRLAISVSTAYVAVKSPERGTTEVFLSSYDECGRVCQTFCRSPRDSNLRRCPGTFRISPGYPKVYGTNFGDSVSNLWTLPTANDQCPTMANDMIYVQFHCNFRESWPFMSSEPEQSESSNFPGIKQEIEIGDDKPLSKKPEEATQRENTENGVCNIGRGCFIAGPCGNCQNGEQYACVGTCANFATCQNGRYYIQRCPRNMRFDSDEQQCRSGACFQNFRDPRTWGLFTQGRK